MEIVNRRNFLKIGVTGAAGFALSPAIISASGQEQVNDGIIRRTLGRTGLKVPVLSFGVMRADNPGLCKSAYEKGITFFDTANTYQNGNNEIMLGNVLKAYPRNSFILATKVHPAGIDKDGKPTSQTTPEEFISTFNTSLSRLQMDYVDILYIHGVSNPELLEYKPVLNTLKKLKKEGKIRYMGFSTHKNEPDVITAAAGTENWDIILTAYNFLQDYHDKMVVAIKKATNAGVGIVAMKTMAGGGFFDKEKTKPINTSAALKWVLANPDIHTIISGMTTYDHLELDSKILYDITPTEQEKKDISFAETQPGIYCSGCKKCLAGCRANLPVPDLMRAYMYAYGYSNTFQAYSLLSDLGTGADPCSGCNGNCTVNCSRQFDVRQKICDVSRLVNVPVDFLS
jgi:predicted aldo/keto reductase-like oxidoreductase